MNPDPNPQPTSFPEAEELRALLDKLCEERIRPEEIARLEEIVLSRPEAEAYYVQFMGMYADLTHALSVPPKFVEEALRRHIEVAEGMGSPFAVRPVSPATRWWTLRPFASLATAAVAVLVAIAALWWTGPRRAADSPSAAITESAPQTGESDEDHFDNTVALVRADSSAEWESGMAPVHAGSRLAPGALRLKSGFVEIEFYSGAAVVLEGPADFEIVSPMEAFCSRGKLRATVPPHAKGFTIGTPRLDLIDRGTEFGLRVDGTASTEVHVFEGKVELYKTGERRVAPERELTTGEAIRIDHQESANRIASDSGAFLSSEELVVRAQATAQARLRTWEARREARQRDPSLAVYYTFDRQEDWIRTLKNQVPGRSPSGDGTIVGCQWGPGRWPGKAALDFRQVCDRVRLHIPGDFDALTIAVWACVDALPNRFSSLLMADGWERFEGHWHLSNRRSLELGVMGPGRGIRYSLSQPLDEEFLGRWTHFAVVYDRAARKVIHYVNGRAVAELPLVQEIPVRFGDAELGNWTPGNVQAFPERFLMGRIDEFLLYSRALSPKEIEQMAAETAEP
ncbi:LamG-like jellyroll fold domain-containing protein [Planctomyces sp. SH-PL14]|uniref:LamG-like jellyroll fold domain-containing protein n=1 Tax=Planctomyces sp. SH-PL14 TaxID=1632864 RepID=UPI00078ED64A|nr:LamG-like jellyroll fold domain-containing protein [Planctomyces sp. SH-PL14]AMV18001.1 FecR protein [Planctomyces sp. SH-PL14]